LRRSGLGALDLEQLLLLLDELGEPLGLGAEHPVLFSHEVRHGVARLGELTVPVRLGAILVGLGINLLRSGSSTKVDIGSSDKASATRSL